MRPPPARGARPAGHGLAYRAALRLRGRTGRERAAGDPYAICRRPQPAAGRRKPRSDEHTSELQSLMRNSYAVFCLKTYTHNTTHTSREMLIQNTHTHIES